MDHPEPTGSSDTYPPAPAVLALLSRPTLGTFVRLAVSGSASAFAVRPRTREPIDSTVRHNDQRCEKDDGLRVGCAWYLVSRWEASFLWPL